MRQLIAAEPDLPVLVLSMHDEALYAERALRAGAGLIGAIRQVLAGRIHASTHVSPDLLEGLRGNSGAQGRLPGGLTERELEVYEMTIETCRSNSPDKHPSAPSCNLRRRIPYRDLRSPLIDAPPIRPLNGIRTADGLPMDTAARPKALGTGDVVVTMETHSAATFTVRQVPGVAQLRVKANDEHPRSRRR